MITNLLSMHHCATLSTSLVVATPLWPLNGLLAPAFPFISEIHDFTFDSTSAISNNPIALEQTTSLDCGLSASTLCKHVKEYEISFISSMLLSWYASYVHANMYIRYLPCECVLANRYFFPFSHLWSRLASLVSATHMKARDWSIICYVCP